MQKSPRSCPQGRLEEVFFTQCIAVPWPLVSFNDFGLSGGAQWEEVRPSDRFHAYSCVGIWVVLRHVHGIIVETKSKQGLVGYC